MNRRFALSLVLTTLTTALVACTAGSGGLGPVPTPLASPAASVAPSPDSTPIASPPDASPSPSSAPTASPSPSSADTTAVRAYFLLAEGQLVEDGLIPVLFEVPATKAVARAAMTELLKGPASVPLASYSLTTTVPPGTRLLGIDIAADRVATVDLSGEFESGGGTASMFGRLAQVVYTLTQFPTVESVRFRIDGRPVSVFSGEGIVIDRPLTRADFEDQLPAIFVDTPAWGDRLANPARVTGTANVFEAQFRIAIVGPDGTVLADVPVMATCGTGCRGTFDVTIPYEYTPVPLAPTGPGVLGSVRVYAFSAKDGSPQHVREHAVVLAAP